LTASTINHQRRRLLLTIEEFSQDKHTKENKERRMTGSSSSPKEDKIPTKRELIQLKPAATPIRLEGDSSRGLEPATYHPIHGILQQAPTISLKNQKVLEEDDYMEALSKIIKRDFFPSLDQFERQKQQWLLEQRRRKNINNNLLHSPSASSVRSAFTNSNLNHLNWSSENQARPTKGWEDGQPTPKITQCQSHLINSK
jgi:protein DGCR14